MTSSSERLDAMARQVQADANSIVRMSAENTAAHIDKYVAAARAGNNASD